MLWKIATWIGLLVFCGPLLSQGFTVGRHHKRTFESLDAQKLKKHHQPSMIECLLSSSDDTNVASQERQPRKKGPAIHLRKVRPRIPVLSYQDSFVCVNKPTGISTHRSGRPTASLVVSTSLKRQLSRKVFPVHRLDHRTSGALLFAFNSATCTKLHNALGSESAEKTYVCLLRGYWSDFFDTEKFVEDSPLKVNDVEKESITEFSVLAATEVDGMPCSLVKARPRTGRTHQIRRHAYRIGMPIIGDSEHGDSRVNRWWRENKGLDRLALHCLSLDIPNPFDSRTSSTTSCEERMRIVAPLPCNFRDVLERPDLHELWTSATEKEPRLAARWIDERGGTLGNPKEWQLRSEIE